MAKQGSEKVPIAGIDNKCQITGIYMVTLEGCFLPPQLTYQGITSACLPSTTFPSDWHVICSLNYWANESTTKDYIHNILAPYFSRKHREVKVASGQPALSVYLTTLIKES